MVETHASGAQSKDLAVGFFFRYTKNPHWAPQLALAQLAHQIADWIELLLD